MNRHAFLDVASVSLSAALLRNARFFSRGTKSEPIETVVTNARAALDVFRTVDAHTVIVDMPVGEFEAAYLVRRWHGSDVPTVIYHHGSGENPFDFGRFSSNSGQRLFGRSSSDFPANLIVVRAPFHGDSNRAYVRSMGSLSNFVGMLATSTALTETLRRELEAQGSPGVLVSGLSLGGFVTNLHRAFFAGADRYVPMLAGAALNELFVSPVYRKLVAEPVRSNPETLHEVLDFEESFTAVDADDCAPVLARYDRLVEFETQRVGYAGMPLTVLEKGHFTGALATETLRSHLDRSLDELT